MQLQSVSFGEKQNFIQKAKASGDIRDIKWIKEQAERGLFYKITKKNTNEFITKIKNIVSVLNSIYSPSFSNCAIWDFDLEPDDFESSKKFHLDIVLHYSKINITNNVTKESHLIKDLIIYLELRKDYSNDLWWIVNPLGTRGTLSFKEWYRGYLHSYLPETYIRKSTDIFNIDFYSYFNKAVIKKCKITNFKSFLEDLDFDIRHEINTPHVTIKDVKHAISNKSKEEIRQAIDIKNELMILHKVPYLQIRDKKIKFHIEGFNYEKSNKSINI